MSELKPNHIGILAIGSEILEGQIADTNSKTLSSIITEYGGQVDFHISCHDNRQEITESLDFLSKKVGFIISIGGLGPTTDDMTRKVLSDYGQLPLTRDQESLNRVTDKLRARGLELLEGHRRQADFPKGAVVLENKAGTADGFYFETKLGCKILVLPGPPMEVSSILENGAKKILADFSGKSDSKKKHSLAFLGLGESQLASEVEKLLPQYEDRIGYRASAPFLELKIWLTDKEWADVELIWNNIKNQFSSSYINPTILDFESEILSQLSKFSKLKMVLQEDDFNHVNTLFEQYFLPHKFSMSFETFSLPAAEMDSYQCDESNCLTLKLIPNFSEEKWDVAVFRNGKQDDLKVSHPMLKNLKNRRASKYLLAKVLNFISAQS